MNVPLLDLKAQYRTIREEVTAALNEIIESQHFILGEKVKELEEAIAGYSGAQFGVGVASGTDALLVSLMALDVQPGDKVITTPYTFFATAGSISRVGAEPVFVDIEPDTYNISVERLSELLQGSTSGHTVRAVVPVHLYGQCADMDPILKIANTYDLAVIEDAAQAIGARYQDRKAGSLGDFGCFSFFPSKNLGGFGDGGMVITNSERFAEQLRILRVHGSKPKYHHKVIGSNSRLDALQAGVLLVKLKHLDAWTAKRRENARYYCEGLQSHGLAEFVTLPKVREENFHIYNQFIIRVKDRDDLRSFLTEEGIGTEIYYPIPLHLQECYRQLGYKEGDFPESEKAAGETLALPIYPELTTSQQDYVMEKIKEFYKS